MLYALQEIMSISSAVILCPLLLLSAGALVLHIAPMLAPKTTLTARFHNALLYGLGVITPILDAAGRIAGAQGILITAVLIIISGSIVFLKTTIFTISCAHIKLPLMLFSLWALYVALMLEPLIFDKQIFLSMLSFNYVKHDAVTYAIAMGGTPPPNNFFYAPHAHIIYYYYFHIIPATLITLTGGMIEARHAMAACDIWLAPLFMSLTLNIFSAFRNQNISTKHVKWACVLFLCVGVDIIPVVLIGALGIWVGIITNWYGENVALWPATDLWAPQHLASLITCWLGFICLAHSFSVTQSRHKLIVLALAALAFTSCFGMSTYVAMGGVLTLIFYALKRLIKGHTHCLAPLAIAGVITTILCAPLLHDIASAHAQNIKAVPIGPYLFGMFFWNHFIDHAFLSLIITCTTIPLFLLISSGIFALGTLRFWLNHIKHKTDIHHDVIHDLLWISALIGLIISLTLRTTISLNDLSWRIRLWPMFAALIWTLTSLTSHIYARMISTKLIRVTIILGLCGTAYNSIMNRSNRDAANQPISRDDRYALYDEMQMWTWLNAHSAPLSPVQISIDSTALVPYGWGLFSHNSLSISDEDLPRIMGNSTDERDQRLRDWAAIFNDTDARINDINTKARSYHVNTIIIRHTDPLWSATHAWTNALTPVYVNDHFKIYNLNTQTSAQPSQEIKS
jgi:hypothetical protein